MFENCNHYVVIILGVFSITLHLVCYKISSNFLVVLCCKDLCITMSTYVSTLIPTVRLKSCKNIPIITLQEKIRSFQNLFLISCARAVTVNQTDLSIHFQVKNSFSVCQTPFFLVSCTNAVFIPSISSSTPFSSVWWILANTFAAFLSFFFLTSHLRCTAALQCDGSHSNE